MGAALDHRGASMNGRDAPFAPPEAYDDGRRLTAATGRSRTPPIDWNALQGDPPPREWVVPHWVPHGHTTLIAGRGGVGKTLIAQHVGTALALGAEYVEPLDARRVLMWAGEDDEAELWRRQVQISSYFGQPLSALAGRFVLHSYAGRDITLAAPSFGVLAPTPLMDELRAQVGDYRAEVVFVDNAARVYGGSENDRHSVTTFLAWLQAACAPAAVVLLAHPAKAAGSEYSGSTAWEGAVRARLYLSDRPPDQEADEDAPIDDSVRYLARRKANYSPLDIRKFALIDGVLIPSKVDPARVGRVSGEYAQDVVRHAVRKLASMGEYGVAAPNSANYLPKLASKYALLDDITEKQFAAGMYSMHKSGSLVMAVVGRYSNRNERKALVLADMHK
jgi:hypothetical protein